MRAGRREGAQAARAAVERLARASAAERPAHAWQTAGDPLPPEAGPAAWTAFDQEVRGSGQPLGNHIALRLCHPDGRIRASALGAPHPPLPLVAIRTADWAPPVRERARRVLDRALAADPAGTLPALTPLVLRLGRREHGAWALERIESLLRRGEDGALDELLGSEDLPTRRFAARLSLERGAFGVRELARRAAAEHDPVTSRLWTDAALAAMAADGPDDAAVDALLGGHGPMVRAAGVTALRRAGRAAQAVEYLTDRSGMVRACARWLVRQDGGDPYAHYRELVTDPARVSPYAVAGFCECAGPADAPLLRALLGHGADAPLLRALLGHGADAVRAAAVAGLSLDGACDPDLLLPLLDDPSACVAREVARALTPVAGRLPCDPLLARIAPERPLHTRRAAYRLLCAQSAMGELRASVELLTDGDPILRRKAAQRIRDMWSSYRPPALPARDPEVGALLDRCTELFREHTMAWIRKQLALPPQ
ncbi:hypothetical protein [Streptomyces sp. NPDC060031]|uniref:hypothetical protein n=1 Tax=Streptomyces sp. NPDC060031 TaxID=3347043 RepID=UPI0036B8D1B8